jgi:glyoxylase-like metal-dependent hydrolase (beta-lactamase superfamily II)
MELPYLDGRSPYPPPDATVGGGLLAATSWLFPRGPIDLGHRLHALPEDGSVPGVPGWRWVFTPGHSPGHVSLFRDEDRCLIAGDAFVTTQQGSALAVFHQTTGVHGPPAYFTPDWESSRASVETLAALRPSIAATGHGLPLQGAAFSHALDELARDFDHVAVPRHGRYVRRPAITDSNGIVSLPPAVPPPLSALALGVAAGISIGLIAMLAMRNHRLS